MIEAAALAYGRAAAAAMLYSTGIEARDEDSIRAIVNLALLTGNLGKEGAGVFPLTEHNNLQGVCDMGMLPDRLPGYRPVTDAEARAAFESIWRTTIPAAPGRRRRDGCSTRRQGGSRRSGWAAMTRSTPRSSATPPKSLERCELVVVQHLFMTDTARTTPHVVLPTTAFGEEQVTFTSTERRIQIARTGH